MAYLCGTCVKSHKKAGGRKKGRKKGKRRGYAKAVSLSGAPVNTKSCKRAFAACIKKKRNELIHSAGVYGDIQQKAETYCRTKNRKVKKACKY